MLTSAHKNMHIRLHKIKKLKININKNQKCVGGKYLQYQINIELEIFTKFGS